MARNTINVNAPPERVYEVLLDPWAYPRWVVGARTVRGVDDDWPAVGSRFHHTVGVPPVHTHDTTKLVETVEPSLVVLDARARPFGEAFVKITIQPAARGSCIVIEEEIKASGPVKRLSDPLIHARNIVSLQRLRRLVDRAPKSSAA